MAKGFWALVGSAVIASLAFVGKESVKAFLGYFAAVLIAALLTKLVGSGDSA